MGVGASALRILCSWGWLFYFLPQILNDRVWSFLYFTEDEINGLLRITILWLGGNIVNKAHLLVLFQFKV